MVDAQHFDDGTHAVLISCAVTATELVGPSGAPACTESTRLQVFDCRRCTWRPARRMDEPGETLTNDVLCSVRGVLLSLEGRAGYVRLLDE